MIHINFVDGTYGRFLEKLLNLAFCNIDLPTKNLSPNGTWHVKYSEEAKLLTKFSSDHFYRSQPKTKQIISIECQTSIEKALSIYNWTRVADFFPFVAGDILRLTRTEFLSEHALKGFDLGFMHRTWLPGDLEHFQQRRAIHLQYILDTMYDGEYAVKENVIRNWVPEGILLYVLGEISLSYTWPQNKDEHQIVPFKMISLFDDDLTFLELNKISEAFEMPTLAPHNKIVDTLHFFRENIRGLPDINLIQRIHSNKEVIPDLSLHDRVLLDTLTKLDKLPT